MAPGEKPARITFNPLTLHVDNEVWSFARQGDPFSRFVLAHELGHIILHDHHAKAFSEESDSQIPYAENEHSAEWQANTFAAHFLLPDHIARSFGDVRQIVEYCDVPEAMASERLNKIKRRQKASEIDGDVCNSCGDFALRREGMSLRCDTCGEVRGA